MSEIDDGYEAMSDSFRDVKAKVGRKGWGLLFIVLLIGISIGFFANGGFTNGCDDVVSSDCVNSLSCETDCLNFYAGDVNVNHSLECGYKCLRLLNCED